MANTEAWRLIGEALNLREEGTEGRQSWTALQTPIISRAKQAVAKAPNEPDVLLMASWLLVPYTPVSIEARSRAREYQERLERLGGPSKKTIELIGGQDVYRRHLSMVKKSTSGCVVTVLAMPVAALALFAVGVAAIRNG